MKDKLTALEAAMLGMWLMGCHKVFVYNMAELSGHGVKVGQQGDLVRTKAFVSFAHGKAAKLIGEALGYGQPHEIAPWLTAHGITPPEVE